MLGQIKFALSTALFSASLLALLSLGIKIGWESRSQYESLPQPIKYVLEGGDRESI